MESELNADTIHTARHSESGATSVEYALMVALIALVIFGAVGVLGTNLALSFKNDCVQIFGAGNC